MATTNLGRVAIVPRGTWNAATTYKKLDLVTFEGSSYIALQNNSNKPVSNTTYWQKIAQKGDQGIQGIQGIQGETGNGIASIELTNTSGAVKTYTITYTNGNTTTFQVTDGEVTNEVLAETLEAYALNDGYYENMTVGAAENLTGKGSGVPAMFTRRTTGGDADVADGIATLNTIKGNSILFVQMVKNGNFVNTNNWFGNLTNLVVNDGTLEGTMTGSSSSTAVGQRIASREYFQKIKYHKLLITFQYKSSAERGSRPYLSIFEMQNASPWGTHELVPTTAGAFTTTDWQQFAKFVTVGASNNLDDFPDLRMYVYYNVDGSWTAKGEVGDKFYLRNFMVLDLTTMFGSGKEPNTLADFRALFPNEYYEQTLGTFIDYKATGLKTVEFNQWDEEWEKGQLVYDKTDPDWGQNRTTANGIRSKNYIKVFNQSYYCSMKSGSTGQLYAIFYDANYRPVLPVLNGILGYIDAKNKSFTPPETARYMRFYTSNEYGASYKNDICINIAWSGYRNGEYEAYKEHTKELDFSTIFPTGMAHITYGSSGTRICDEITKDYAIQRVFKHVFTGTENWSTSTTYPGCLLIASGTLFPQTTNVMAYGILNDVTYKQNHPDATAFLISKSIYTSTTGNFFFNDPDYTTNEALKQHLAELYAAGTPLVLYAAMATGPNLQIIYEKRTDFETSLNLNYIVSDFGTEEIISNVLTAPISADIVYGMNAADTLRRLPENYISKDSMEAFLSTLNTATNGTWSMSYDSETSKYVFSYVANEEQQGGE